jgi:CRP/FNR family cyclic AMP-dependent transcriptional regulator
MTDETATRRTAGPHVLGGHARPDPSAYCLVGGMGGLGPDGTAPWAPGRREELADVERRGRTSEDLWCMAEVDIFADLSDAEMETIAAAAPMREFAAGELLYSPPQPMETLFILKQGRVRIFRVSADGRALTTAIVTPGTIFGEMLLLGQQMHDNYAEALDKVTVCVMSRRDVEHLLLSDARIAARISEILGNRVSQLERRLSDTVFKSVPERIATTLCLLADQERRRPRGRGLQVSLTHEQVAALAGTSRETTTKVLNEFADAGLLRLGRGKFTILDLQRLSAEAGE